MYEYLCGHVVSRGEGAVVLECHGIGYRLEVSASTLARLPPDGEAQIWTHLLVREDSHLLYGFAEAGERHLFRQLLQVSGVGPSVALGLLSTFEPAVLAAHIAAGELTPLTRAKGVGKRTAERILVELRDRIRKEGGGPSTALRAARGSAADAVLALCSLGLPRAEAERRLEAVADADLSVEDLVRAALQAGA